MIYDLRYNEDLAAVQHAAKRAVETLTPLFYQSLERARSRRARGDTPMRDWLAGMYLSDLTTKEAADYFTGEFRKLQAVIESDDQWVEKEIARFFKDKLGLHTVELDLIHDFPRFREVSHMPVHEGDEHLQPQFQ